MIITYNNLKQVAFSSLFIAFQYSNHPKVETIFKDQLNFVSIKVNESEYNCTDFNRSVKYGQRKKSLLELCSVKTNKSKIPSK